MATEVLRVLDRGAQSEELARAGAILRAGGLVAFPTETVYGIAVAATEPAAVERLYELKQRPRSKPMSMMVAGMQPVRERCPELPEKAVQLMKRFWPGSLTLVVPTQHADGSDAGLIGFRYPSHPLAQGLVEAAGVPLLVPSANLSGEPPATTADEVLAQFPDQLDLVIDGGPAQKGLASTVVKIEGDELSVLREGAIPQWRIEQPNWAHVLFVCTGNTDRSPLAAGLLRRQLAETIGCSEDELEDRGYRVSSAGLAPEEGARASRRTRRIAEEAFDPPVDLEEHRAQKLTQEMLEQATRVICMERAQREQILAFFPHRVREVMLLDPEGDDIHDPAGQSMQVYKRLARRLDAAAILIAGSLVP
ncbi:MAG: L-threonylcarbamoyladenylate synthase [Planctomycetota bacterium]|nr:L-threonylcarbamoyladenylate synthase [Planctomycetota bacterium]